MFRKLALIPIFAFSFFAAEAQRNSTKSKKAWVDSVFKSLSKEERISQLMVIRAHSNLGEEHVRGVMDLISKYNVGSLCWFQGGPVRQAILNNQYQAMAKTPLLMTIDGEWGLGMRLDSVIDYPYQLTLGALPDPSLVYTMGRAVGKQMKRIGIHVNYAPVVDINNNPANPVIGYRSFGEDKEKVANFGVAYVRGMQDEGIMACAKHFPGHGDVSVDSHYDLPLITKSIESLDSLELYPFKKLFKAKVGSVMIAHLAIPAIDTTTNLPTSLSKNNINELLRDELDYEGLTFTDALEMKGVTKFFPAGEAAVLALMAGNDMLCLPDDVPAAIEAVKTAIKDKRLKWKTIDAKVKKVLAAKYDLGLSHPQVIDTTNLLADINAGADSIRTAIARSTVTVVNNASGLLPFAATGRIAYVALGLPNGGEVGNRLATEARADVYAFSYKDSAVNATLLLDSIRKVGYNRIIIGVHNYSNRPTNNYNISPAAVELWKGLNELPSTTILFGNVYAAQLFIQSPSLVAAHQDDEITRHAVADFLQGRILSRGKLPVTVGPYNYGTGIGLKRISPAGFAPQWLVIDSIVNDGIAKKAFPGAVVLAVKDGEIKYHKAFGKYEFDSTALPVTLESIYDLASVTKISATTVGIMKLYEEGKIGLDNTLGDYLPVTRGSDKAGLKIRDILLHQAGLNPYISFYRETIDAESGGPSPALYRDSPDSIFSVPVALNLYMRRDWNDSMVKRIVASKLTAKDKYVYSDNDFILLGKVIEAVSGLPLDEYVKRHFYIPMGMTSTDFNPWRRFGRERVVPTEEEKHFRKQLLKGFVHDEGAAMFGGVSGHAGLFSNAYDLSLLYQMLLNEGELNGRRYLKKSTIDLFTAYGSEVSRRGLGFDKPEKDNSTRKEPYPSSLASSETFGHTGFTGTCVWADPKNDLVYIFLSNRVYNTRTNNLLGQMGIRGKVQDAIYRALEKN